MKRLACLTVTILASCTSSPPADLPTIVRAEIATIVAGRDGIRCNQRPGAALTWDCVQPFGRTGQRGVVLSIEVARASDPPRPEPSLVGPGGASYSTVGLTRDGRYRVTARTLSTGLRPDDASALTSGDALVDRAVAAYDRGH